MKHRAFASEYTAARREIDSIDALVRALDSARDRAGLTKAELAKRVGMAPEVVRRLFTATEPNPTIATFMKLASAVDCSLGLVPRVHARRAARRSTARAVA